MAAIRRFTLHGRGRALALVTVLAILAGSAAGFYLLVAGGDDPSEGPTAAYTGDFLLTSNRTELAFCVDVINQNESWIARGEDTLREALTSVKRHPAWLTRGLSYPDPTIDHGCPGVPFAVLRNFKTVEMPSPYRLHLYITDVPTLHGEDYASAFPEEEMCQGDVCFEVTSGLYVTPEVVQDPEWLARTLVKSLGLEPPGAVPTPYIANVEPSGNRLEVNTRDRLSICVDYGEGSVTGDVKLDFLADRVLSTLLDMVVDETLPPEARLRGPEVQTTCAARPEAFEPGLQLIHTGELPDQISGSHSPDRPSSHRIFLFVISEDSQRRIFEGDLPILTEEFIRQGHVVIGVTTGLYLTPAQANDDAQLRQMISRALGLSSS